LQSFLRPVQAMGTGFALVALSGYVFVLVAARDRGSVEIATLTFFYFLATTLLLGANAGLDQVTNRRVAFALARGEPLPAALRRTAREAAILALVLVGGLAVFGPIIVQRGLHGDLGLLILLMLGVPMALATAMMRGILAGAQDFTAYGRSWAVEGLARLILMGGIALWGPAASGYVAAAYLLPYLVAIAVAAASARRLLRTPRQVVVPGGADGGPDRSGLVPLVLAALLTTAAVNLPQLILANREVVEVAVVATLGQMFVLSRLALMALTPVQAVLLPALTRAVALKDFDQVRRKLRLAVIVCGGAGVVWSICLAVLGVPLVRLMFPSAHDVSAPVLAVLGVGSVFFAVAAVVQPALVAFGAFSRVTAAWAVGTAVTAVIALLPWLAPAVAAVAAAVAGPIVIVGVMSASVLTRLRGAGRVESTESGISVKTMT
jgi:O-antigen/teichoic acid export membrane protein